MRILSLNGEWRFRAVDRHKHIPGDRKDILEWMPATVPGTVHTDLLALGKIEDPYYRMNENDVQWVDRSQWEYERTFEVDRSFLEQGSITLVAGGLDTFATVTCNGKPVASTENMFIEHRFDVRRFLRLGSNIITVRFDSPTLRAESLERRHGPLEAALELPRVFVRKAQYSFGWDWGPRLTTSGIWRDISLEGTTHARLSDPVVKIRKITSREAVVTVVASVTRYRRSNLSARIIIDGGESSAAVTIPVRGSRLTARIRIPHPELWWPNGMGHQKMYHASITLRNGTEDLQFVTVPFALRTVRLIQKRDMEGKSFIFEINGKKVYCKGADWIPGDNFLPRMGDERYRTLLMMAKDAHMNMIRVWGGGIYENDIFYNLCDQLGLMVWQDFMYACAEYPDKPWFTKNAALEASAVVKRLRNHPSIVLWCGNNECEWIFCTRHPEKTPDDMQGAIIFRDILPAACAKYDGSRPYWRSSPFGSGFPNTESNGNHHQWEVWSMWKDYPEYEKDTARFVTEFGFQGPAHQETMTAVMRPEDRHPQSAVMEHHNKQVAGTERLFRFQAAHYRVGGSFEEFVYLGQLVQAEALRCAVEHWRRRKWRTAGSLFWQLNDCWPVSSWAVVDSALRPKAAFFYAKKFFAPVLLSMRRTEKGVEVWLTSDLERRFNGTLTLSLRKLDGQTLWSHTTVVRQSSQASKQISLVNSSVYAEGDPGGCYVLARIFEGESMLSESRVFFVEPKHMALPTPVINSSFSGTSPENYVLTLVSDALARNVEAQFPGRECVVDDNFFDLDAGEEKVIHLHSLASRDDLRNALKLHWLQ